MWLKIIQSQEHVDIIHEEANSKAMLYHIQSSSRFVFSCLSAINVQSYKACVDNSLEEP